MKNSRLSGKVKSFLFKNITTEQTFAKNAVWLSISNFGGRLLKAAVIIYAARILGASGWGVFSYAVTLAGFFTLFVDPGINAMLMREGAKANEEKQLIFLSTTFFIKLAVISASVIFIILVGPYFTILPGAKLLLPVTILIIAGDALREFLSAFIRAREKMEWETAIFMLTNLLIVVFGFIALFLSPTPRSFGWAYAAATSAGALAAVWFVWPQFKKIFSKFSFELVAPIMRSAWPFAVTGALGALLTNADILIISWLKSAADVGVYSAAIRIIQLLYLFPTVVVQYSILPVLARLAVSDKLKFREALEKTVGMVFFVSAPLAFVGTILGTEIMGFIFGGAYVSGGLPLKILMLTMIVDYPGAVIASAIFANDRQKSLIATSAIAGISNVLLDVMLIPRFGITGSAAATLAAQTLATVYLWRALKKTNDFEILPKVGKIILSALLAAAASAFLLSSGANIILNVAVSSLIYLALLKILRDPIFGEMAVIAKKYFA